ncbi:RNA polymerase sigma-70 factor [Flavivirga aquimarina]|uniref:RNA polymerase sigma-70 factor n=1 Tax=Flavivirga aquimarina TaxID=2027862 RepID=A0ABT8W6L6_9FLAO|nr:RNA polymerase sigma-70 factor [Flavivirga aquimarina]MDO5968750.1 RNA polymerase sigma-70 factor [Flavivirga aquimarina]
MNYKNEKLLIEHLKKGEQKAFIYIVDNYNQRLFGYALSLTNDLAMAQDIIQNVFLRTWERRKKIDIKTSLQNYLFKSVHNEFLNQYKKNQSAMLLEQKYFDALEKTTESYENNIFEKIIERVKKEIETLPPKCKEVFLLSRKDGLTNIEISDYLNISIKTVEAHITKAFSILRKTFSEKVDGILFLLFEKKHART